MEKKIREHWYDQQPGRWDLERKAIENRYPVTTITTDTGIVECLVPVQVLLGRLKRYKQHQLRITVPASYPNQAPRAYAADISFPRQTSKHYPQPRPRHLYNDDALCLYYPKDPPEQRWLPEDGIVMIIIWAEEWLTNYYIWKQTNKWRGKHAH